MRFFIALAALLISTSAYGVTQHSMVDKDAKIDFVSSKPAERAVADVQIRRIKQMISSKRIDPDVAFDRWEKLQHKIRGR